MNTFILYLTLAIVVTSYAFLMSVLNKVKNLTWLRWESYVTAVLSTILLIYVFQPLLISNSGKFIAFGVFLFLATINSLLHAVVHFKNLKNVTEYPETIVSTTKTIGIIIFASSVLALLSLVASFSS